MIDLKKAATVFIGRRGENHFRNLEFDVSSLLGDEYPSETLTAIYKRPDGVAYPVVTSCSDGVLTWSPGTAETEIVGVGQLEIRVTHEDVVGKSARVLTIVEEALSDGIAEPPEPPAQEWLNQVLSALAAIDVNDAYALLNLTYNLLNDNYTLLGTTHGLLSDNYTLLNTSHGLLNDSHTLLNTTHNEMLSMRDKLYTRTGIILNHLHPVETASAPDMASRRASITFAGISAGSFGHPCGKYRAGTGSEQPQQHCEKAGRSHKGCPGCGEHYLWQRNKSASYLYGLLDKTAVFRR